MSEVLGPRPASAAIRAELRPDLSCPRVAQPQRGSRGPARRGWPVRTRREEPAEVRPQLAAVREHRKTRRSRCRPPTFSSGSSEDRRGADRRAHRVGGEITARGRRAGVAEPGLGACRRARATRSPKHGGASGCPARGKNVTTSQNTPSGRSALAAAWRRRRRRQRGRRRARRSRRGGWRWSSWEGAAEVSHRVEHDGLTPPWVEEADGGEHGEPAEERPTAVQQVRAAANGDTAAARPSRFRRYDGYAHLPGVTTCLFLDRVAFVLVGSAKARQGQRHEADEMLCERGEHEEEHEHDDRGEHDGEALVRVGHVERIVHHCRWRQMTSPAPPAC